MRSILFLLSLLLFCPDAMARQAVMNKDAIACWQNRDFQALAAGEYRMNYWGSHQQKMDYIAQGRCFALRQGEPVTVERLIPDRRTPTAKLRKPNGSRSFWTVQGFD